RKDYLDKISTEIIKNHDVIGIEDLQVSNMLKNRKLAKAISEVTLYVCRTIHLPPTHFAFLEEGVFLAKMIKNQPKYGKIHI
ncbi:hypothetical protein P5774_28060, partial [Bacillus tropicus]|nr:hypothetical protein [Bacillus tropicus]